MKNKKKYRGCQHKVPGTPAKKIRQEAAWDRCKKHNYKVQGQSTLVLHGKDGLVAYQQPQKILRCKSCGAPGPAV